jgi:UPF0755 protein
LRGFKDIILQLASLSEQLQMNFLRHKKQIVISTVFFMSALFFIATLNHLISRPLLPENALPLIITLDKATTASQFTQYLKDKKLISSTKVVLALIRYNGLSHQLKAGVYQVNPGETPLELLQRIAAGDVMKFKFTIIEGTTQKKIGDDLGQAVYLKYNPEDWSFFQKNHSNAEGLLLADTYQYPGGADAKTLLFQANRNLTVYLSGCWSSRAAGLPYKTPYDLLIAASIIEKETAVPQERKLISGVVLNRLNKKMPLQMDPTVIYALGKQYKGTLSHNDMSVNSPYNTYINRGLPPTPIAMVGKEAIDAAAHPQISNYLYFFAKGDGTHQFSQTYEEQKQAINQYKRKGL